jgi:hypothetical protein
LIFVSFKVVNILITVAIVTRRLKEGKTYEDFRKAWYHTVGFGTNNKMFSLINAFDDREIIVIGLTEIPPDQDPMSVLNIDVKERLDNPLDEVIEPEIGRKFGILISEDDFSPDGAIEYRSPSVNGKETDLNEVYTNLSLMAQMINQASEERDRLKNKKN